MPSSFLPFLIVVILCLFPTRNRKFNMILTIMATVIMVSLFAFFNNSVDQFAYKVLYYDNTYFEVEEGYIVLTQMFKMFGLDYSMFKIVFSLILITLLFIRFRKYNFVYFRIVLLIYFLSSYCFDAEQSRFTFAGSIVLIGTIFLEKKGIWRSLAFILVVLLSMTIHTSCFFFFALLLIRTKKKTLYIVATISYVITLFIGLAKPDLSPIGYFLVSFIPNERIIMWFSFKTQNGWIGPFALQVLFFLVLWYSNKQLRSKNMVKIEHKKFVDFAYKICLIMFLASPLYCFAVDFLRLIRIMFVIYLSAIMIAYYYSAHFQKLAFIVFLIALPFVFAIQGQRGLIIMNDYFVETLVAGNEIGDNVPVVLLSFICFFVIIKIITHKNSKKPISQEILQIAATQVVAKSKSGDTVFVVQKNC